MWLSLGKVLLTMMLWLNDIWPYLGSILCASFAQSFWPLEEDFHPRNMMYVKENAPQKYETLPNSKIRGFNKRKGKIKNIIKFMGNKFKSNINYSRCLGWTIHQSGIQRTNQTCSFQKEDVWCNLEKSFVESCSDEKITWYWEA